MRIAVGLHTSTDLHSGNGLVLLEAQLLQLVHLELGLAKGEGLHTLLVGQAATILGVPLLQAAT